eukprot:TRINITY_DN31211_c0_g1_i1.p1 TRINITY_DN31211_c0_g1~~TRINITY_DN31211_c0_g1_i1.p1  ORF type:complete len:599 (+),score=80.89 TRINITY_DN31211_c0_g1_i1:73-1869(+)
MDPLDSAASCPLGTGSRRHSASDALMALNLRRQDVSASCKELLDGVCHTRQRLASMRSAVAKTEDDISRRCAELLELAASIDRDINGSSREKAALIAAEREIRVLQLHPESLQLGRSEKCEHQGFELAASELEIDALTRQAEEAERLEQETREAAEAAIQKLEAEERTLCQEQELDAELAPQKNAAAAVAGGLQFEDQLCYEWLRMLGEDKPWHAGLAIMEAECDSWEGRLHDHIAPSACSGSNISAEGHHEQLARLDAELGDLTAAERARRTSCGECLQLLSQNGAWQPVYSSIHQAYRIIQQLQTSDDLLAGDIAGCCWQKLGARSRASHSSLARVDTRPSNVGSSQEPSSETYLPPGPRFYSPVHLLVPQTASSSSASTQHWVDEAQSSRMPSAVVTNATEWNRGADISSKTEDNGLSFLVGPTKDKRLRPSISRPSCLASATWGSFEPSGFSNGRESITTIRGPASSSPARSSVELLRQAFKEPLSRAVGGSDSCSHVSSSSHVYPLQPSRPPSGSPETNRPNSKTRSNWVTFQAQQNLFEPQAFQDNFGVAPDSYGVACFTDGEATGYHTQGAALPNSFGRAGNGMLAEDWDM